MTWTWLCHPPISMHTSGRRTVSRRHTLPSPAQHWPDVGSVISCLNMLAQHLASIGPAPPQHVPSIGPTSGRHRPDIGPTSAQHRPDIGPMLGRCQHVHPASAQHRPSIDPASAQHRPSIGPASARHRFNIGPTSAWHQRYAGCRWLHIGPASAQHQCDIGPTSVRHRPDIGPMQMTDRSWPALVQFRTSGSTYNIPNSRSSSNLI